MNNVQIPPPKNWQDFELLCHALWMAILEDENTMMHGRQGQAQAGIDVYGTHQKKSSFHGIQAKGKDNNYGKSVSERELRGEVAKALTFKPDPPGVFILATTAARDKTIQKVARQITKELRTTPHKMKVYVYAWEDICERLWMYPQVIEQFYPNLSPKTEKILQGIKELSDSVKALANIGQGPSEVQLKLSSLPQIAEYFELASNGLLSWPRNLSVNDEWIDRPEEEEVLTTFHSELGSTTILLGEPGTGKSALLSKVAQTLADDEELVLAIKADQLDGNITDFVSLGLALGLPGAIDECLLTASQYGTVYLLLDQLDTLSEFVDVKTQRLSVLLNLIKRLSHVPNIHILASSRPFEFKYDVRLSSIKAQAITLPLIAWEITEAVLKANGVIIVDAEENFKSFLGRPSNLNFYLRYIRNHPHKHFQSHIELYEDIWNNSLGDNNVRNRRASLLIDIASKMTNDARQTLPLARYDEHKDDIDWLCDAGIFIKNESSKAFSFAHQTLQAFAWTRAFIRENLSLVNFILQHQDNLNIRPKLVTVVLYLRDADSETYQAQLKLIFGDEFAKVRKHVIHLLIDCIGAHHDPNELEVKILSNLINDDIYQARICNAVSGKVEWFDALKSNILPKLMTASDQSKFAATFILSSVVEERKSEVLQLVESNWKNANHVNLIYYVLRGVKVWDDEMFALAYYVSTHENVNPNLPGMIFQIIANESPATAIRYTGDLLSNRLQTIIETPQPTIPDLPESATEVERYIHHDKYDPKHAYERLMNFGHSWHNLATVAQKDPKQFVLCFWNSFLTICDKTRVPHYRNYNAFISNSGTWFRLWESDRNLSDNYFSTTLEQSIRAFAQQQPDEYMKFYRQERGSDLLSVQRILAIGLSELPNEFALSVLDEILSDDRYFKMGDRFDDKYLTSRILVEKLSSKLDAKGISMLERKISQIEAIEKDNDRSPDGRIADMRENRRVRYLLLKSVSTENRSVGANKTLAEEYRALGNRLEFDGGYSGLVKEISPMTDEQMSKAKDDDIVNCFKAFPDNRMRDWHTSATYQGPTELARTFEKFAEKFPDRAITIIRRLDTSNTFAIGSGVNGVSRSQIPLNELLDLIELLESTLGGEEFYIDAATAIAGKLLATTNLSIEQLEKIERWIAIAASTTTSNEDVEEKPAKENSKDVEKPESVLWRYGRMHGVPRGNFEIIQVLMKGYLLRETPLSKEWCDFLVRYINLNDRPVMLQALLIFILPKTFHLNSMEDNERVLNEILLRYPEILLTEEFAHCIAASIHYVSSSAFFSWVDRLKASNDELPHQVYGELLGLKWAIHSEDEQTLSALEELIVNEKDIPALCGLAFALKNLWEKRREPATHLLSRLTKIADKKLAYVLLGILRKFDLEPSTDLNNLLDAFIANKTVELSDTHDSFIIHTLVPIAHEEPKRVAAICEQIISINGKHLGDVSTSISAGLEDLITVAITIHNLGPEFQKIGLDIFESLLHIDAYQVKEALGKIDAAPRLALKQR